MTQNHTTRRKWVAIIADDLPSGLAANTAAVLALTLGKAAPDLIGPDAIDSGGTTYPGLTTLPLPVLTATSQALAGLADRARSEQVLAALVTDAAQRSKTYPAYTQQLASTPAGLLTVLGLAILGPATTVNRLTGNLPLLR
jgi:hypothetical protein